ncbi:MAG: glycosyltransferase [Cycloclasticus sp.]
MPVYNNLEGLLTSLASINKSIVDGFNVDVIIVDDGSSPKITLPAELDFSFGVVSLKQAVNSGIVAAMNAGLEYILEHNYHFIARLDAGDTVTSDRFIVQIDVFNEDSDVYLVGSYASFVDMLGNPVYTYEPPVSDTEIRKAMHYNNALCHPAVMFRAEGVIELGDYSKDYPHAEDYEYFYRFIKSFKVRNIAKPLVNVEVNPSGISIKNRRKQVLTRLKIQLKMFELGSVDSFFGLLKTFSLLALPYSIVLKIKNILGKAG